MYVRVTTLQPTTYNAADARRVFDCPVFGKVMPLVVDDGTAGHRATVCSHGYSCRVAGNTV